MFGSNLLKLLTLFTFPLITGLIGDDSSTDNIAKLIKKFATLIQLYLCLLKATSVFVEAAMASNPYILLFFMSNKEN